MLTAINNYNVKRLLLNGYYICSTSLDSLSSYLLCSNSSHTPSRSFRTYQLNSLSFSSFLFPIQTSILAINQTFNCFYIPEGYELAMTRFQRGYSVVEIVGMFMELCQGVGQVVKEITLRQEAERCLSWDNVWVGKKKEQEGEQKQKLVLVWHQENMKQEKKYNEQRVLDRLIEIFKMMWLSSRKGREKEKEKEKSIEIAKSILSFQSNRQSLLNPNLSTKILDSFISFLTSLLVLTISQPLPCRFPTKTTRLDLKTPHKSKTKHTRYSIDHTDISLQKSLKHIKNYRKKTIDVTNINTKRKKYAMFSLFESFKRNISPRNDEKMRKSKERAFSKDLTNYENEMEIGHEHIRESSNMKISNLLRNRAIEAFEVEKQYSIDATRVVPNKTQLLNLKIKSKYNNRTSTWRESLDKSQKLKLERYESIGSEFGKSQYYPQEEKVIDNKSRVLDPFKMKMLRFQKKKDTDDRLMKLFNSNRQPKINVYVELPERVSTVANNINEGKGKWKGKGERIGKSEIRLTEGVEGYCYTAPSDKFVSMEKEGRKRSGVNELPELSELPLNRNIFENNFMKERSEEEEKEPSEIRELINRLVDGPMVIRTISSEMEFEKVKLKQEQEEQDKERRMREEQKTKQEKQRKQRKRQKQTQELFKKQIKKQKSILKPKKQHLSITIDPTIKPIKSVQIHSSEPQQFISQKLVPKGSNSIKITREGSVVLNERQSQLMGRLLEEEEDIQEIVLESRKKKKSNDFASTNINASNKQVKTGPSAKVKTSNAISQPKTSLSQNQPFSKRQQNHQFSSQVQNPTLKQQQLSTKQKQKSQSDSQNNPVKEKSFTKSKTPSYLKRINSMQVKLDDDKKSSHSDKSHTKIQEKIDKYIQFINLIGQAVSKSQKVCKSFKDIDWFTGVYFLYKRFYRERKRIEQWLQNGTELFHRASQPAFPLDDFQNWLTSSNRNTLLLKIQNLNLNIFESISKMNKTLHKKCINSRVLKAASLESVDPHESNIMMQYVLVEYDELMERQEIGSEVGQHLMDMLDAIFIVAELDGKQVGYRVDVKQKKQMEGEDVQGYFRRQRDVVDQLAKAYNIQ